MSGNITGSNEFTFSPSEPTPKRRTSARLAPKRPPPNVLIEEEEQQQQPQPPLQIGPLNGVDVFGVLNDIFEPLFQTAPAAAATATVVAPAASSSALPPALTAIVNASQISQEERLQLQIEKANEIAQLTLGPAYMLSGAVSAKLGIHYGNHFFTKIVTQIRAKNLQELYCFLSPDPPKKDKDLHFTLPKSTGDEDTDRTNARAAKVEFDRRKAENDLAGLTDARILQYRREMERFYAASVRGLIGEDVLQQFFSPSFWGALNSAYNMILSRGCNFTLKEVIFSPNLQHLLSFLVSYQFLAYNQGTNDLPSDRGNNNNNNQYVNVYKLRASMGRGLRTCLNTFQYLVRRRPSRLIGELDDFWAKQHEKIRTEYLDAYTKVRRDMFPYELIVEN